MRVKKGVYAIRALMGDAPYESIGRPQPSKGAKKSTPKHPQAANGLPGQDFLLKDAVKLLCLLLIIHHDVTSHSNRDVQLLCLCGGRRISVFFLVFNQEKSTIQKVIQKILNSAKKFPKNLHTRYHSLLHGAIWAI